MKLAVSDDRHFAPAADALVGCHERKGVDTRSCHYNLFPDVDVGRLSHKEFLAREAQQWINHQRER